MILALNIAILTLGSIGALAAFGGETWEKNDKPIIERVTKRGWISIICLILALIFGITKEIVVHKAEVQASQEARNIQDQLKTKLDDTNSELVKSRVRLQNLQTTLLTALESSTAGIPREIDHPFYSTFSNSDRIIRSPSTREPLRVYAGQLLKYQITDSGSQRPNLIKFEIGRRIYDITDSHGEIRIIGMSGVPMDVKLNYPRFLTFAIKMTLVSSTQYDAETQINLLRKVIEDSFKEKASVEMK